MWFNEDTEAGGTSRLDRTTPAVSPLRIALLFSSAAVAFALVAMSYLGGGYDRPDRTDIAQDMPPAGVDTMSTGSITPSKTYVVRKSVLQHAVSAVCIISSDGGHSGDC